MGPNEYVYEVEIPDLRPDRAYVAKVRASNSFKEGEWSREFRLVTSGKGEDNPWFYSEIASAQIECNKKQCLGIVL